MNFEVKSQSYGKSAVRLLKLHRTADEHTVTELRVRVLLDGDFDAAYTDGDNSAVVATDTMKNTVYALAHELDVAPIETFAAKLARHFTKSYEQVERADVEIEQKLWERLAPARGDVTTNAFRAQGPEKWTARAISRHGHLELSSGIRDLEILKTELSAFSGFPRDRYTTLEDTEDRLLGTSLRASWRYSREPSDPREARQAAQTALLETFAQHESHSVQHTLYEMAIAALEVVPQIDEITLAMPNQHRIIADLGSLGVDNAMAHDRVVFVSTSEPYGDISATVRRLAEGD